MGRGKFEVVKQNANNSQSHTSELRLNDIDRFFDYFEILPANTESLKKAVFRLRYQVYCMEHPFEDPSQFPSQSEQDHYDARSSHCLIRHKSTGWDAATVRLVFSAPEDGSKLFPIEQHCGPELSRYGTKFSGQFRRRCAEISRFAVSKDFRRRVGEEQRPHGITPRSAEQLQLTPTGSVERRYLPFITLGLFRSIVQMSAENDIDNWLAVMEPMLLRLLKRFGILFHRSGQDVQYHGSRVPVMNSVEEVLMGIRRIRPEVYQFITDDERYWKPLRHCANHG
jgi:N-acyl amino acid synthase of PEP-CTERM/exosortase system